ncbi:extracellular solute-binding protein [Paenibacillus massiliensis]|uniref:extracellular solute-binding protein n=1 Tax=Paenibacillus massiliensis TaxID=225917 RepID=UPI000400781B|nr:extracellular solute-binding protein [Paenibacillus massiliensis]
MVRNKRSTSWIIGLLVFILVLSACTNSGSNSKENSQAESADITEISIMTTYYTPQPPDKDNPILKEIEKRTNTKLNITWVSPNNYNDKASVTLASGDLPDMMLILDVFSPQVRQMSEQGAFWEMTELYKNYPKLSTFPEDSWNNIKQSDGKTYGVPRVRPVDGGAFPYLRKDWLDALGLDTPANMDELYNVLKAFVERDSEGDRQKGSIGIAGFVDNNGLGSLGWVQSTFTQNTGDWKLVDGKLTNVNLLPEVREALIWLNRAYQDKLIPEDFAVMKLSQAKDLVLAGKAGGFTDTVEAAWEPTAELRKTVPEADYLPLVSLNDYATREVGYFGMYVIPRSVSEAKMNKIMEFLEYGATDEGYDLVAYGFKDIHHTEKDGFKVTNEQYQKDAGAAIMQIWSKYDKYFRAYRPGMPVDIYERNKKIIDERAKVSVPDAAFGLYSETSTKVGVELQKKIQDLKTQVILGAKSISDWDHFVAELKMNPDLIKITNELNESYRKRNEGSK